MLYTIVLRALQLREALDIYTTRLRLSKDDLDREIYNYDYLSDNEQAILKIIKEQLELLFLATKSLEGNAKLKEGALKASHGALWELLLVFKYILKHFEDLQIQAQRGDFNDHPGIQSSITLAQNKTAEYYKKTNASIAWMAAVVLHPWFKQRYFDDNWKGNQVLFVRAGKANLKRLWESKYKTDDIIRVERSPEPSRQASFIEDILDSIALLSTANTPRPTA